MGARGSSGVAARILLGAACLAVGACRAPIVPADERPQRPNVLFVVADDLGYSDLGSYGGEIETPTIDALAENGLRAINFYVSPRGAPSRAMLLTGVDHHLSGFGGQHGPLDPDAELPTGYEGHLNQRVVTLATLLREAGYHTVMAGKWEVGEQPENLPSARGFERSFVLHDGAASHWADMKSAIPGRDRAHYTLDDRELTELPEGYYSSEAFTDFVIQSLAEQPADRPFFAYLSYQAPHSPLAAPEEWIERCEGRYDAGFGAVRRARLLRMKSMGLVREDVQPYPGLPTVPGWEELDEASQAREADKMQIYCAMVENMDFHLGRLVDALKERGVFENTLIFFLSDNGASASNRGMLGMDLEDRPFYIERFPEADPTLWGGPDTFLEAGPGWAQVSMTPFRLFKGTHAEGGIRSPLVVHGPGIGLQARPLGWLPRDGRTTKALLHVTDLPVTVLDLAGVSYPERRAGTELAPLRGESLAPLLRGGLLERDGPRQAIGFELAGQRAGRLGKWKIVSMDPPLGAGRWRLYRIDLDPSELYDRAEDEPERVAELVDLWTSYARQYGVRLPEAAPEARDEGTATTP